VATFVLVVGSGHAVEPRGKEHTKANGDHHQDGNDREVGDPLGEAAQGPNPLIVRASVQ
jgi:hypothetical protein